MGAGAAGAGAAGAGAAGAGAAGAGAAGAGAAGAGAAGAGAAGAILLELELVPVSSGDGTMPTMLAPAGWLAGCLANGRPLTGTRPIVPYDRNDRDSHAERTVVQRRTC
jgi:hypothetical protein